MVTEDTPLVSPFPSTTSRMETTLPNTPGCWRGHTSVHLKVSGLECRRGGARWASILAPWLQRRIPKPQRLAIRREEAHAALASGTQCSWPWGPGQQQQDHDLGPSCQGGTCDCGPPLQWWCQRRRPWTQRRPALFQRTQGWCWRQQCHQEKQDTRNAGGTSVMMRAPETSRAEATEGGLCWFSNRTRGSAGKRNWKRVLQRHLLIHKRKVSHYQPAELLKSKFKKHYLKERCSLLPMYKKRSN